MSSSATIEKMKNFTVSRIYHSREDRISDLHGDNERVQYDGFDVDRIESVANTLNEYTDNLDEAMLKYTEELEDPDINEDSASQLAYARRDLIEKWALCQGALSKVAWALRIDGNIAYERMIEALKTGAAVDMRGL